MLEIILIAVIVFPLIIAANREAARGQRSALLALLTFGLVNLGALWRICDMVVKRLSYGEIPAFDPDKPVHRTAALLLILGVALLLGISLADDVDSAGESSAINLSEASIELIGNGALHLGAALLGVGWFMRRRLPDVLRRLSLRMPTVREAGISVAVGVGLWVFSTVAVAAWEQAVPAEVFQRQTEPARLYFAVFSGSVVGALMLAIVPALSEEIFYRGALQPVFGILLTSLFFTATHLQYALTPATIILFVVSLGFAGLRLRFHTSAAIIAHAVFNFLPFLAGG